MRQPWARPVAAILMLASLYMDCRCARSETSGQTASGAQTRADFAAKAQCADRGAAYLKHEKGEDYFADVKAEQFTYNKSLNTCLIYFEVFDPSGISYNIADTLTNRRLYQHVSFFNPATQQTADEHCKSDKTCLSEADLQKKRVELFEAP
jgi:hypothetical protein